MRALNLRSRVLLAFAAFGLWWGAWGAFLPAVQRSARVTDGQLGSALLFVGLGALVSMRVTGHVIDRTGAVVLPVSVAAFGVAGAGPALVEGTVGLSVSLALLGATSGAFDVAINAEGSRYEASAHRSLLNLAHACFSAGVIAGSLVAGAMRTAGVSLGWALLSFAATLVAVAVRLAPVAAGPAVVPDAREVSAWPWWRPPRLIAALGSLLALAFLVESAWQSWSAVHLERDLGASAWLASTGPAAFAAAAAAGRLVAHRGAVPGREVPVVVAGAAVAAVGTVVAAAAPWAPLVLAGIAVAGAGTAVCAPSLIGLAGLSVPPAVRGAAIGTVTTAGYAGFVVGPALVGAIAGATTLSLALGSVAIVAVVLSLAASRLGPARSTRDSC